MKTVYLLFFILIGNLCLSQTITWTGTGGDLLWDNTANWNPTNIPTLSNDVIIPSGFMVEVMDLADARSLYVSSGSTLIINSFINIGNDITLDTAIVNNGTIDNTDGHIDIGSVKSGIRNNNNGLIHIGSIGIYIYSVLAIDNYGTIQSSLDSNIDIAGVQCINNSGSFTIGNANLISGASNLSIYNSGSIKIDSCSSFFVSGYLEQTASATLINDGYIETDMTTNCINGGSIVNNGVISDDNNRIEPYINTNTGWSLTKVMGTYCALDDVTPFFAGTGSDLSVILGTFYLNDFITVAGNYNAITNTLTFLPAAIGNNQFIMDISDDNDGGCIISMEIIFENLISAPNEYYEDSDSDMYGDPLSTIEACSLPSGYTTDFTDCDDSNNLVYPGASEICDGLDNDCNMIVDDGPTAYNTFLDTDNDKDWFNANNWSLGIVPYACHNVIVDGGKTVEILTSNAVANSILIEPSAVLDQKSGSLVIHVGNTYGIRNEGTLLVKGMLELTGIGETALQTATGSITVFKVGLQFISYDVGGEVFHNQGLFTIENTVSLDFANSFAVGSDLILNEGTFHNNGHIIFPFINSLNGIYCLGGNFFNNPTASIELAENLIRFGSGGIFTNSPGAKICASTGPYSCP